MDQINRALLIICLLAGITSPAVLAQDTDSPQVPETTNETQPIEEITVIGERTFFGLRLAIESAETEVYKLFNELNSNDEFDVTCTREVYVGSHFKQRNCMPAFLREEQARNTQNYLMGIDVQLTLAGLRGEVHQKSVAMEAEMLRLAVENEQFAEALQELTILVGTYQEKKKENPLFFGK